MGFLLSQHRFVHTLAAASGAIFIGFGINAFINPLSAISFFEIEPTPGEEELFALMMPVYGIRNILIGFGTIVAAYYRHSRILGCLVLGSSIVAAVDGLACYRRGIGQGNHWGYAPQLGVLGLILLGALDGLLG